MARSLVMPCIDQLQRGLGQSRQMLMCRQCGQNLRRCVFIPCGHLVYCRDCCPMPVKICPVGKQPVDSIVDVRLAKFDECEQPIPADCFKKGEPFCRQSYGGGELAVITACSPRTKKRPSNRCRAKTMCVSDYRKKAVVSPEPTRLRHKSG